MLLQVSSIYHSEVSTHLGILLLLLLRTPHRIELFLADAIEQRPHRDALAATLEQIINLLTPLGLRILRDVSWEL